MATMATLDPAACDAQGCTGRATRSVSTNSGHVDGYYCPKHAASRLVQVAKEEGAKTRPTIEVAKPIESGRAK